MADQKIIRKTYEAVETKASEGEDRTLVVTISTNNPDRSKDVVVPEGMESEHYLKNPVVAAFHNYNQPAIGKTIDLQQTATGVIAKVQFLPKGIYPLADQLYEMYKAGFMNAWSIGFIPKERTDLDPDNWRGGSRFDKWELLEYSAVLVPDNPEALTMLRSKGIDEETIEAAQHVEPEADSKEVEKDIAAVTKKTEALSTHSDGKTSKQPDSSTIDVVEVTIGKELDQIAFTLSDGKTYQHPITAELKDLLLPADPKLAPDSADLAKALNSIRDSLKPADKEIGLALRTLKQLIANPSK